MGKKSEYIKLIKDNLLKAKGGSLAHLVENPTPSKIKMECIRLFGADLSKSDKEIFDRFLLYINQGIKDDKKLKDFKKIETSKFKPIQQFILKSSKEPRYIEHLDLAALLFDVKPRPFNTFLILLNSSQIETGISIQKSEFTEYTAQEIEEYTRWIVTEDRKLIKELEDKYPITFKIAVFGGEIDESDKELKNEMTMVCMKITDFWVEYILNKKRMDKDKFNGWITFNKKMYANSFYLREYIKEHKYLFDQDFLELLGIKYENFSEKNSHINSR